MMDRLMIRHWGLVAAMIAAMALVLGSAATGPASAATEPPPPAEQALASVAGDPVDFESPIADLSDGPVPVLVGTVIGGPRPSVSAVVRNGPRDQKRVALTFDDNFGTETALRTLAALRQAGAPATAFVVGQGVDLEPAIVDEIARNPQLEVGDHSGLHVDLALRDSSFVEQSIGGGVAAYRQATAGHAVSLFRPPGGSLNATVLKAAAANGFPTTVLWDCSPGDFLGIDAQTIVTRTMASIRPGSIVLLHLNGQHTAEALPLLVQAIRAAGYRLVTVSQLLKGGRCFSDVSPDDPAQSAVLAMDRSGLLRGYPTGDFGATEGLSRRNLARALVIGLGLHTPEVEAYDHPTFADVLPPPGGVTANLGSQDLARFDYIEEAVAHGLMQGAPDADGKMLFRPTATVRRIDLALAVARATADAGLLPSGSTRSFTDVPPQAAGAIAAVVEAGLMNPVGQAFSPWEPESRAHAARVLQRLFAKIKVAAGR
jgi:peptidoglycan/xylan/chitin deacetylase (PgdA/CDA1 family)